MEFKAQRRQDKETISDIKEYRLYACISRGWTNLKDILNDIDDVIFLRDSISLATLEEFYFLECYSRKTQTHKHTANAQFLGLSVIGKMVIIIL
jgi:hypothetical protein